MSGLLAKIQLHKVMRIFVSTFSAWSKGLQEQKRDEAMEGRFLLRLAKSEVAWKRSSEVARRATQASDLLLLQRLKCTSRSR